MRLYRLVLTDKETQEVSYVPVGWGNESKEDNEKIAIAASQYMGEGDQFDCTVEFTEATGWSALEN